MAIRRNVSAVSETEAVPSGDGWNRFRPDQGQPLVSARAASQSARFHQQHIWNSCRRAWLSGKPVPGVRGP